MGGEPCLFLLESDVQGQSQCCHRLAFPEGTGGVQDSKDPVEKDDLLYPSVLNVLRSKHPPAQPVTAVSLIHVTSAPRKVHPLVYDNIDTGAICSAALNTRCAGGPSGLDAHCWRCLCTFFHALMMVLNELPYCNSWNSNN